MSKIYCIIGKSASGKDKIYGELLKKQDLSLKKIVPYTTRPVREGETEGREYHFASVEQFREAEAAGRIIESRAYNTYHGTWFYYTMDDGQICSEGEDYLVIGTLEAYLGIRRYFGEKRVIPIYIYVEDGERLLRAVKREQKQTVPRYEEMCRRFLADAEDFAEERLREAQVIHCFENRSGEMEECVEKIAEFIRRNRKQGKVPDERI